MTIKDVAKEANVSISVVSYVLNNTSGVSISDDTKERVRAAAEKLHYVSNRFARGLREQKSMCIGIVPYWNFDVSIFMEMLDGINREATANGYRIILCTANGDQDFDYLDCFHTKTIDGAVFIAPHEGSVTVDERIHIQAMQEHRLPFVIINGHTNAENVRYINFDFYGSAYTAATALIQKGFRDITYITPDSDYLENRERLRGYREAMADCHLTPHICLTDELANQLQTFRAVVTNKADTAHAVMKEALKQGKRIPEDFVLIAANTESYCGYLFPSLSSVKIPARELGGNAVKALLGILQGKTPPLPPPPRCTVQYRESTAQTGK